MKESLSGDSVTIPIRVNSMERTFGIGLSEEFRGGNTIIAQSGEISELEIRLPKDSDTIHFKPGHETEISVKVADWNAIRRRIILESD